MNSQIVYAEIQLPVSFLFFFPISAIVIKQNWTDRLEKLEYTSHPEVSVQKFLRQWRNGIPLTLDRNQSLFLQLVHNMRKNNRSIVKNCHCNNYQITKIYKMNMTNLFSIFINSSQEGFSISNNFMMGAFKKRLITCKV